MRIFCISPKLVSRLSASNRGVGRSHFLRYRTFLHYMKCSKIHFYSPPSHAWKSPHGTLKNALFWPVAILVLGRVPKNRIQAHSHMSHPSINQFSFNALETCLAILGKILREGQILPESLLHHTVQYIRIFTVFSQCFLLGIEMSLIISYV